MTEGDLAALADIARSDSVLAMALSSPNVVGLPPIAGQANTLGMLKSRLQTSGLIASNELRLSLVSNHPDAARVMLEAISAAFLQDSSVRTLSGPTVDRDGAPINVGDGVVAPVIISRGQPASTLPAATWPRPIPIFSAAALAGLLIGGLLGAWVDARSLHLHDADDALATLQAPLLGTIPDLSRDFGSPALRAQSILAGADYAAFGAWNQIARALEKTVIKRFDCTILVTSVAKARGKTTLACNLAIAMARAGQRVILIDGNPRSPAIGEIFDIASAAALGDVLEGRLGFLDAPKPTGLDRLFVLPAGKARGPWPALLSGSRFADLLDALSQQFDRIVIDGPALETEEGRILAHYADVALMAVDVWTASRASLRRGAEAIRMAGARLAGFVWNCPPHSEEPAPAAQETFIKQMPPVRAASSGPGESSNRLSRRPHEFYLTRTHETDSADLMKKL